VIASEDDGFVNHDGVDWNAIEKAWERNNRAEQLAAKASARAPDRPVRAAKIRGGSTITQQLAKNLLLSGERTLLRKGQEFVLTLLLERMLSKQRILEIYLNSVEWGDGVFGAEAAAQRYYKKSASRLNSQEAARLAVMLPAPKRFEKTPARPTSPGARAPSWDACPARSCLRVTSIAGAAGPGLRLPAPPRRPPAGTGSAPTSPHPRACP
jgi:monofunctional biosynthetic peptidoglycan transglycosylase